jgi:anti-sigma factor ChrR (cupin superfamily)
MNCNLSVEESRERAALYALGILPDDEAREFERHLADGCDACTAEVGAFTEVTATLGHATAPQSPRPEVRTRVLEQAVAAGTSPSHLAIRKDRLLFIGSSWMDWMPGNAPGVEVKILSIDQDKGYYTTLVRLAPGASLAPHRHADVEESYIVEGELLVSGVPMRPGDYCRAEAGSMHTGVTTKTGCIFIAVASLRDEWLPLNA